MRMIACYNCGKLILKHKAIIKHIVIRLPKELTPAQPWLTGKILAEYDDHFCSEQCKRDFYYEYTKEELKNMYQKALKEGRTIKYG